MAKGRSKTSPSQIQIDERHIAAVNLRKSGATYQEIANELGFAGTSGAEYAVRSALEKTMSQPADELRDLELARLNEMQMGLWSAAISGDTDSVNTVLRLMERRARLLGLDAKTSPLMNVVVSNAVAGNIDFSGMTNDELREHIQRETVEHDDSDNGTDAAGIGEA